MRGVKHEFGMLFTHERRLTPELERSNTRGRLAQAPENWEESARREGGGRRACRVHSAWYISGVPEGDAPSAPTIFT